MCQTTGSVWSRHQLYTYVNAFLDQLTIARYDHCHWWSSPGILHCAVVCPHNVTLIHWWVNGEHCLVGAHDRINYSLGLLVGIIERYHSPISPPGDSGSRSTSGGAGDDSELTIIKQAGYTWRTWKCRQTDNGNLQLPTPCNWLDITMEYK